jgi:AraC-like DNA-binding protein
VKARARAHRWQVLLEGGEYGSIEELARAEKINPSYLARVLRLTLLAPEIVESILDGRHDPERVALERLMRPFPALWGEQLQSL